MQRLQDRRANTPSRLHSIRSKIFFLRIGIGVTMSLVIGLVSYLLIHVEVNKNQDQILVRDNQLLAQRLDRFFYETERNVQQISDSEQIKKYLQAYREQLLIRYFAELSNSFDLISLISPNHFEEVKVVKGQQAENLRSLRENLDYQKSLETPNKMLVSGVEYIPELGEPGIQLYYLYTDFFDQHLCTLRFAVSLSKLGRIMDQLELAPLSKAVIVSDDGTAIYVHKAFDRRVLKKEEKNLVNLFFKSGYQEGGSFSDIVLAGNSFKFYQKKYPSVNWTICVGAEYDLINKPIKKLRNILAFVCLAIVLCGELLSRFVGLRITEPISRLNKTALAIIHSGRAKDRVEWQSMDEIGALANSFNLMLDRLDAARSEIIEEKIFIEQVFSSMIDGMAIISLEGQIVSINSALSKLLGYNSDEISGLPFSIFFPSQKMPLFGPEKIAFVESLAVGEKEIEILTKSNEKIPVSFGCTIINDRDDQPNGMLLLFKDIREEISLRQKQREAESKLLETRDELLKTEKIAVVGQMAGMVAHEVLNPVSAVNVRIDLSLKKAEELAKVIVVLVKVITDWQEQVSNSTFTDYFAEFGSRDLALLAKISETLQKRQADRLEDFQFLQRQVMRIIKIIDGLREMSRRERTIEKIKLANLVDEVIIDMEDGIRKRGIVIEKVIVEQPEIMADYMEMYSIFSNILKNGMQAIEKKVGGERKIKIELGMADSDHARIAVTDSGIGMDAAALDKIFTPGFTSKGREGTGIGSGFSRKLARQYGGDIIVADTKPGVGTTVHVVIALKGAGK